MRDHRLLRVATATMLAVAAGAVSRPAVAEPPDPPPTTNEARAAAVAGSLVAGRPARIHAGSGDAFVQLPVISSAGWQYVPYERTYRGLPVVGGDFVVVVDPAGQVSSTSVAQQAAIGGVDTVPRLSQGAAEKIAYARLAPATGIESTRLVMDALGAKPTLAWESTVVGRDARGPSKLIVEVDATTGSVLRTREGLVMDAGHSAYNGPDPVIVTSSPWFNGPQRPDGSALLWALSGPGYLCTPLVLRNINIDSPFQWGNGDPTSAETGCVDAVYATRSEMGMSAAWLGRSGLDGTGRGFNIRLAPDFEDNALYDPSADAVTLGRRPDGKWFAALDIVAHENGHGIDDHTPGGLSGGGTSEFVADAFGTATEWYANEPAPFDTPDYILGDNSTLDLPQQFQRHMYLPFQELSPMCYTEAGAQSDPHVAAGIGDHWFYLLAEGTNPADGQPPSPACNSTTLTGVGIQRAIQILYSGMLMKTSASSYSNYRLWTLTAVNNVFPGDCWLLGRVKAAWDAILVPAQPGERSICVPAVVGASRVDATNAIVAAGLSVGTVTEQASTLPQGTVLAQSPAGGSPVAPGSAVNLTVAAFSVVVPNVVGQSRNDAVNTINAVGLSASVRLDKQCVDPSRVLSQSPPGGAVALAGSVVRLTVDSGTIKTCGIG